MVSKFQPITELESKASSEGQNNEALKEIRSQQARIICN